MSNVTLWLPAGEFAYIRSHTKDTPADFDVDLEGETNTDGIGCLAVLQEESYTASRGNLPHQAPCPVLYPPSHTLCLTCWGLPLTEIVCCCLLCRGVDDVFCWCG
jgi:hypothetical protein